MERQYSTGISDSVVFFTGVEVERTPAYDMNTLFVTGIQPTDKILQQITNNAGKQIQHVFFGANHSYHPVEVDEFEQWNSMIKSLLTKGFMCSLDIPSNSNLEWILESGLCESNDFIPQIRVAVPYVKLWNYNTMIKIDDIGFDKSNPGVWCHSLHSLMDQDRFTGWRQYNNDFIIK